MPPPPAGPAAPATLRPAQVTVELKNDLSITGTLHSVDQYLNIKLNNIRVVNQTKYPHMLSVRNCFIRGSVVRYVQVRRRRAALARAVLVRAALRGREQSSLHPGSRELQRRRRRRRCRALQPLRLQRAGPSSGRRRGAQSAAQPLVQFAGCRAWVCVHPDAAPRSLPRAATARQRRCGALTRCHAAGGAGRLGAPRRAAAE